MFSLPRAEKLQVPERSEKPVRIARNKVNALTQHPLDNYDL